MQEPANSSDLSPVRNRREAIKQVAGVAAGLGVGSLIGNKPIAAMANATNPIVEENKKQGTTDWQLKKPEIDPATRYRSPWIEGYCSHASIRAGETLDVMVSANPVSSVTLDLYRLGYYGGTGARWIETLRCEEVKTESLPETGENRVMVCQWPIAFRWTVPKDALSGVYLGKLTNQTSGHDSYVIFIVRDDRQADFVFQCSDHTWQAYNRWPNQFSLYDDGVNQWYWGGKSEVSFLRPYGKYCQIFDAPLSIGSGEFLLWEFPFAYWMESLGYDVTYVSNTDTHSDPSSLLRCRGWLSIGHDEYWTIEMFRNAQAAVQHGVSLGFFSGNAVCGRVTWNEKLKSLRRVGVFGPPDGTTDFVDMDSLEHIKPYANELMGAHSTGPVTGGADWICTLENHWIYAKTGMKHGDRIPGVIGWEWHGDPAPIPGLEVVATGPTQSAPDKPNGGQYTATVYPGPKGNFVFNAATIWWADGLSAPPGYVRPKVYTEPKGPDARIQQMTRNVLDRMLRK
ncbi:MAG: hypothetical protein RLY14_1982 [Planctomycetota bacterium]|jgi:hypothetical protein